MRTNKILTGVIDGRFDLEVNVVVATKMLHQMLLTLEAVVPTVALAVGTRVFRFPRQILVQVSFKNVNP